MPIETIETIEKLQDTHIFDRFKIADYPLFRLWSLVVRITQARSTLVSLQDTAYYHWILRCVRRAFLFGEDHYSDQNFEHRGLWLVERMRLLSQVFAIDMPRP